MWLWVAIKRSWLLLARREQIFLLFSAAFQSFLTLLDLIGIGLMGVLASAVINGRFPTFFSNLSLDLFSSKPTSIHVSILLLLVLSFFLLKFFCSLKILIFTMKRLAKLSIKFSEIHLTKFLKSSTKLIVNYKPERASFLLNSAVTIAFSDILGAAIMLLAECALLLFTVVFLLYINYAITILILVYFCGIFFLSGYYLRKKQSIASQARTYANIQSTSEMITITHNIREIKIYQIIEKFVHRFQAFRSMESQSQMRVGILIQLPKYVLELGFYIGLTLIFLAMSLTLDTKTATIQFAVFLTAGSRIMPSLVRVQGHITSINIASSSSEGLFELINDLKVEVEKPFTSKLNVSKKSPRSNNLILVENVKFSYVQSKSWALQIPKFELNLGDKILIRGESGSGKSTFVDLILQLENPSSGSISYSHELLDDSGSLANYAVGYVPQRVNLFQGSILDNISFYDSGLKAEKRTTEVLSDVGLLQWLDHETEGVTSVIENFGNNLSGGQIQRIGIARALYRNPKILILDEPTSFLDKKSEVEIIEKLFSLPQELSVIVISHSENIFNFFEKQYQMQNGNLLPINSNEKFD